MIGALPSVGPAELLIVLAVLILLFGARTVPRLARSMGQTLGELRHATRRGTDPADPESE